MKRLIIAALSALAVAYLLGLLSSALFGSTPMAIPASSGYTDPVSSLATAIAMCVGGYIAGKRFIPLALLIMVLLWTVTLYLLTRIAVVGVAGDSFMDVMAFNAWQIALSVLAACAGAAIGAWLRMRRPATKA